MSKFALITGASSGIGEVYARQLVSKYQTLALVARREDRLHALKDELSSLAQNIHIIKADLTNQDDLNRMCSEVEKIGCPDLIVNNAGYGSVGAFENREKNNQRMMVRLNSESLMEITLHFIPGMLKRGSGGVINVASIAGFVPIPYMATYAATKAFVHSFSMSLYAETRARGVHIMSHCPGPTKSEFHIISGLSEKMSYLPSAETDTVVREAIECFEAKKPVCVNGKMNKFLSALTKLIPWPLTARLVRYIMRKEENR